MKNSADQVKEGKEHGAEPRIFNHLSAWLHRKITRMISNIRLSLTFRIAIYTCFQIIRTTIPVCLLFSVTLIIGQAYSVREVANRISQSKPDDRGIYSQLDIQDDHIEAFILPIEKTDLLHQTFFQKLNLLFSDGCQRWTFLIRSEFSPSGGVLMVLDISGWLRFWCWTMLTCLIADAMRMIYVMRHHRGLDKRVLAPIRDMTEVAATLSGANLSNRINVAGTKNELQDLAIVINSMLDKIELSMNSQKQFVSDASHELRTPIAVIQGYADMLNRWGKDDPAVLEEGLHAISQETTNMKGLVENLLFLARHDKKTLLLEKTKFDVYDVANEVCKEMTMVAADNPFEFNPHEHCVIEADRSMIKQVLRILAENAVKYSKQQDRIIIGTIAQGNKSILIVTDHGMGIKKEDLPKIFDRFYRSDEARHSEAGGHGLGLSIARIIVVAHKGRIQVRSKPGVGTTFRVVLPVNATAGVEVEPSMKNDSQSKNQ